jgi:hypothetical protein
VSELRVDPTNVQSRAVPSHHKGTRNRRLTVVEQAGEQHHRFPTASGDPMLLAMLALLNKSDDPDLAVQQSLDMVTTALGGRTGEMFVADLMKGAGIQLGQGYGLGKPTTAPDVEDVDAALAGRAALSGFRPRHASVGAGPSQPVITPPTPAPARSHPGVAGSGRGFQGI